MNQFTYRDLIEQVQSQKWELNSGTHLCSQIREQYVDANLVTAIQQAVENNLARVSVETMKAILKNGKVG